MPAIAKIALAATNVAQMVTFYNSVLDTRLTPIPNMPDGFHAGELAGIPLVLAPNAILNIDARQNRQQFDFVVDDIEATMQAAQNAGGRVLDAVQQQGDRLIGSVYDPDGNTMVFIQQVS